MRPPYECSEALCGYRPAWRFLTAFYKEVSIMNETKQLNHDYLTISEVKDYLNISQSKAYELAHRKDGTFSPIKIMGAGTAGAKGQKPLSRLLFVNAYCKIKPEM